MEKKTYVRAPRAAEVIGVSVATLWRWAREDETFPAKRRLSARVTVWCEEELRTWADERMTAMEAEYA